MADVAKSAEQSFRFALRNGGSSLAIDGSTVDALRVESDVVEAETGRGMARVTRSATVGALKSDLPTMPRPGARAKLDDWECAIADGGVEDQGFAWVLQLETR